MANARWRCVGTNGYLHSISHWTSLERLLGDVSSHEYGSGRLLSCPLRPRICNNITARRCVRLLRFRSLLSHFIYTLSPTTNSNCVLFRIFLRSINSIGNEADAVYFKASLDRRQQGLTFRERFFQFVLEYPCLRYWIGCFRPDSSDHNQQIG